jgi:hypothetical protein
MRLGALMHPVRQHARLHRQVLVYAYAKRGSFSVLDVIPCLAVIFGNGWLAACACQGIVPDNQQVSSLGMRAMVAGATGATNPGFGLRPRHAAVFR